jgi:hypothetical protein
MNPSSKLPRFYATLQAPLWYGYLENIGEAGFLSGLLATWRPYGTFLWQAPGVHASTSISRRPLLSEVMLWQHTIMQATKQIPALCNIFSGILVKTDNGSRH